MVVAIDGAAAEEVMNHVERLDVVVRVRKEFDADHGADDRVAVAAVERRFAREIYSGAKGRVLRSRSEGHRWRRESDENGGSRLSRICAAREYLKSGHLHAACLTEARSV